MRCYIGKVSPGEASYNQSSNHSARILTTKSGLSTFDIWLGCSNEGPVCIARGQAWPSNWCKRCRKSIHRAGVSLVSLFERLEDISDDCLIADPGARSIGLLGA
jgi:hypothetical protein